MNIQARGTAVLLAGAGLLSGLLIGTPLAAAASPGTITTVAGGPGMGPAKKVFQRPDALAASPGGALYVGDIGNDVREFSNTDSYEGLFAGTGGSGFSGDGGPATSAQVSPSGLAVDRSGNLLIADARHNRIRVVAHRSGNFYGRAMTARDIYTVAGNGSSGFSGDGGPARSAALALPQSVAVDAAGNLVIADTNNGRVRVVAEKNGMFYGQAMKAGNIYTVAGNGTVGYTGDGGTATAAELDPGYVTVDPAGNIVISDTTDSVIRVVAERSSTFYGVAMKAGDIYTVAGTGKFGYSGDGGPATAAQLDFPGNVAVDPAGNLTIADASRVRVVAATTRKFYGQAMKAGDIYTVAGDGAFSGPARSGGLATATGLSPSAVTFDAAGNLVIADNTFDRVWVVAATTGTFYKLAMTADHVYIVAGNGTAGFSGAGGKAVDSEGCCGTSGDSAVAVDGANYIVLGSNQAWFVANRTGTHFGQAMRAGDIYVVAGNGKSGGSGDGGIATSARFNNPDGVAVDAGNLVISDAGTYRVRMVAARTGTFFGQAMTADHIYTVAGTGAGGYSGDGGPATSARLEAPEGVAVDRSGNLIIAVTGSRRIRVVAATTGNFYGQAMKAGDIYTVAGNGKHGSSGDGGPATAAALGAPAGVAVDRSGNLVVSLADTQRIRVVAATTGNFYGQAMKAGDIYTVAGNGKTGYSGDGGPATAAELNIPQGVAVDRSGNLIIADSDNNRIRVVAATTGNFYGQAMKAGDIYTVAGNGKTGCSGDGGPGTSAALASPEGAAVNEAGNLVIDDSGTGRLRVLTG